MEKVTLDTAKNIIGGTCNYSFDLVTDACVMTTTCTVPTSKYGQTATNITKQTVASSFCGVEPAPGV